MDLKALLNQTTIDNNEHSDKGLHKHSNEGDTSTGDGGGGAIGDVVNMGDVVNIGGVVNMGDVVNIGDNMVDEIDSRFKLPWNKLETGVKMNRILVFVSNETKEKSLSVTLSKDLKNILFNACDRGLFNKVSDVKYDTETGKIESFKCLEFNEVTGKYKLRSPGTKKRSVSKSRSNIDRLISKKS